jgi:hydrogenase maturation protease
MRREPPLTGSVALVDVATGAFDLVDAVRGATKVVVVDSCRTLAEPGTIYRCPSDELAIELSGAISSHSLRFEHVCSLAEQVLGEDRPRRIEVVLIEAGSLGYGWSLSPAVEAAVERVSELLAALAALGEAEHSSRSSRPA